MKITKRQLRRIIKEEKQKLLMEMNPLADAERTYGSVATEASKDQIGSALRNFLNDTATKLEVEEEAYADEADEKAHAALVLALAYELQSLGLVNPYNVLYNLVRNGEA